MPKIVRFHEVGGPEVLRIEEEAPKHAGKGEVRLKVQAVGLNRAESMFIRGQYLEPPNFFLLALAMKGRAWWSGWSRCGQELGRQAGGDRSILLHERLHHARRRGNRAGCSIG